MNAYLNSILSKGYAVSASLAHADIIPFVQANLKHKNQSTITYLIINVGILVLALHRFGTTVLNIDQSLTNFGVGIFACVFLIPIHELIHGFAYYTLGARSVSYKANFRKFVFYAIADKFVVSASQFKFVAIAPFFVITASLLTAFLLVDEPAKFVLLGALLFHTAACSGDFGLMSYLDSMKDAEMITYDDRDTGESYFLIKV